MTPSFHQQARRRKLIYFGLIALLLTLQMFHRKTVEKTAEENDLRETNIGQVDLGGSAARFALTSFRGPLICALWWDATERMKRHEWNELELLVRTLAKLQPHFEGPWRFQGWNIAFNVSVEFDRVQDKYFYIAEGIRWLTEGERVNRSRVFDPETGRKVVVGNPDLRNEVGFMIQDKMSNADEAKIFRCFLPLSCIVPANWDPSGNLSPARSPEELKRFKAQFPQWTRRFRDWKRIPEGAEAYLDQGILALLAEQRDAYRQGRFPSLFRYDPRIQRDNDAAEPFPIWPVPEPEEGSAKHLGRPNNPEYESVHNSFEIARRWYEYSQAPLPPPEGRPFSQVSASEKKYYRMPKRMVSLVFRKQPAQAVSSEARAFGQEGWFDKSDMPSANALDTWKVATKLWHDFGIDNALEVSPERRQWLETTVRRYSEKYPELCNPNVTPPSYRLKDPEIAEMHKALGELVGLQQMKHLANYEHWKQYSETNATPEAMQAYRFFHNGARRRSDMAFSLDQYERGLTAWEKIISKPRSIEGTDLRFLLGLGPAPQLLAAFALQPDILFQLTPIGSDRQTQEELLELQDGYLRVRARKEAPGWLATTVDLWGLQRLLSQRVAAPCLGTGLAAAIPPSSVPITLDMWIFSLEIRPTPLDRYMPLDLVFGRGIRGERMTVRPGSTEPPQPPTNPQPEMPKLPPSMMRPPPVPGAPVSPLPRQ